MDHPTQYQLDYIYKSVIKSKESVTAKQIWLSNTFQQFPNFKIYIRSHKTENISQDFFQLVPSQM